MSARPIETELDFAVPADASNPYLACEPAALQSAFEDLLRAYSLRLQNGDVFPALPQQTAITATDAMIAATAILKAAEIAVFELGMWQAWSGNN